MSQLPSVYLVRHGETEWSRSGRHTGRTDVPLTGPGEATARRLADRLRGAAFARVFTSPLQRARRTCELAGFGAAAEVDADLVEWDYGEFEGLTSAQIRERHPGWELFRDGVRRGETVTEVSERADRVVAKLRTVGGDVLVFSSGHFLRTLAARWVGAEAGLGRALYLGTGAVCILGYHHGPADPVIRLWNDAREG